MFVKKLSSYCTCLRVNLCTCGSILHCVCSQCWMVYLYVHGSSQSVSVHHIIHIFSCYFLHTPFSLMLSVYFLHCTFSHTPSPPPFSYTSPHSSTTINLHDTTMKLLVWGNIILILGSSLNKLELQLEN